MLGLKVISLEIHSDLNIAGDIVLFDVSYRRQFFKITLVLGSV